MSLINDALKRASETRKQTGDPPPPVTLNPVDYAVRPNPAFRLLVVLLLLIALAFAGWFLTKWQEHSALTAKLEAMTNRIPAASSATIPSASLSLATERRSRIKVSTNLVIRELPDSRPAKTTDGTTSTADEPRSEVAPESGSKISASATNSVESAGAAVPPEASTNTFPRMKLQSIVYRLSKPAVVINGEMLHVGDTVKDVRILKIDRYEVIVEWHGQTNTLSLPRL